MIKLILVVLLVSTITTVYCTQRTKVPKGKNTYAIQNIKTGKNLRPYKAKKENGNKLIQYNLHSWGCLTWELIPIENGVFKIKNLYTLKTFQPVSTPNVGVGLWQQPITNDSLQEWEFTKIENETYLIKLKGTELYMSTTSDKLNAEIILLPKQNSDSQKWKLIKQIPWI